MSATRAHILQHGTPKEYEESANDDSHARHHAGQYYVRVQVGSEEPQQLGPTQDRHSSDVQPVAPTRQAPRATQSIELRAPGSQVRVNTNSARIAEEVVGMRRGVALQEAIQLGALRQWKCDCSCAVDVMRVAPLGKSMYWDVLTGVVLDPAEVQEARRLEIEYFRQMGGRASRGCSERNT